MQVSKSNITTNIESFVFNFKVLILIKVSLNFMTDLNHNFLLVSFFIFS